MSEMVQRVAGILSEQYADISGCDPTTMVAREIIEAMIEPTEDMVSAAIAAHNECPRGTAGLDESPMRWAFRAAIREALK